MLLGWMRDLVAIDWSTPPVVSAEPLFADWLLQRPGVNSGCTG